MLTTKIPKASSIQIFLHKAYLQITVEHLTSIKSIHIYKTEKRRNSK